MAELVTAYISLVASTDKIPKQIDSALKQAESSSARTGKSMGEKMSSSLGSALKKGGVAAAAAGGAAMAVALTKGFQRLSAIDDAKGKLAGLGHSTVSTAKIMDSALASVKGTAYGLGDAATIAAGAVAAGVKPGQELTKYLSLTADSASIAGVELNEMGSIMNKVKTSGKAMTDNLNELADRGIPIYQWLAEEIGTTAGEVQGLASKGKISSEQFFAAIEKNISGAAQAAGKTVKGSFNNMVAAMGRLGAAAQQPFFNRLPGTFTSATAAIDALTPRVTDLALKLDHKIFEEWGPKVQAAFAAARDGGALSELTTTVQGLWAALQNVGPQAGRVFAELGRASASLGVGTWQLFLATLNASASVLNMLSPALSTVADLMENNRGAVVALVAAWMAFKTVPALVSRMSGPLQTLTARTASARASIVGFGGAYRQSTAWMAQANPQMSRAGVHMAVLGANARMAATSGLNRLKSAGSAVAGLFGGPLGLALVAGAAGFTYFASAAGKTSSQIQAQESSAKALAEAHRDLGDALMKSRGEMTDDVWSAATEGMEAYRKNLRDTADTHLTFAEAWKTSVGQLVTLDWGSFGDASIKNNEAADSAMKAEAAFAKLGLTTEQLTKSVYGSTGQFNTLVHNLERQGEEGKQAAYELKNLRVEFEQQRDVARRVTPGAKELSDAVRVLGDEGASASDKLKALRAAVDALNPARGKTEAMRQYGQAIRDATAAAAGIDGSAWVDGKFDAMSESGSKLAGVLGDLVDKSLQVASTGGDMKKVTAENEKVFQSLAKATGKSVDDIKKIFDDMGGNVVDVAVQVSGSTEVQGELVALRKSMNDVPAGKKLEIETGDLTKQARDTLEKLGIQVEDMPDGKTVQIDADNKAKAVLDSVMAQTKKVGDTKAAPEIDLKTHGFDAKEAKSRAALEALRAMHVSPEADLIIQKLLDGKNISKDELAKLAQIIADPKVELANKDSTLGQISEINTALDIAARPRQVIFNAGIGSSVQWGAAGRADGAIVRAYMNGGISDLESYANGGYRVIRKPQRADIFAGRGAGTIFAEEETQGEAYIPLAPGKRRRSTDILATVADMFGLALVPQDSVSGMLGSIAGGAVSSLLKRAGADGLTRFADGGFTSKQLRELVDGGHGASQPLTGAPYVWGGVNWGDCSAAVSAPARAAAGLDPFGGRMSTGSMGSDLPALGYQSGLIPGAMQIAFYNGGPGGGHAIGRLPDGTNIEMGGSNGGGMVGGAKGPDSPEFTDRWSLRVRDDTVTAAPTDPPALTDPALDPTTSPTPSTPTTAADAGGDTISGRFGAAASTAVSEQIKDFLGVLGINDSPGALAGYSQLQRGGDTGTTDSVTKDEFDRAKLDSKHQYENDKLARRREHDAEMQSLRDDLDAKRISQAEYDSKSAELKKTFDDQELAKKQEYDRATLEARQRYDQARGTTPRDPGTHKPKRGEDLGSVFDSGGLARGKGVLQKDIVDPERVLSPAQTRGFDEMIDREFRGNSSSVDTDAILERLDRILDVLAAQGAPPPDRKFRDEREWESARARRDRAVVAAGRGGR